MSFNYALGITAKAYYSSTPLDDTPTVDDFSTELSNIREVTINGQAGEADISTRATSGWRATAPTLREMEVTFQMQAKKPDAALEAIRTAWLTNAEVALLFLTGSKSSADHEGPGGNFTVTNFSRNEGLEEAIVYDVTVKVSSFPAWVSGSSE